MISRSVDVMVSNRVDSYVYPIVSVSTHDPNRRVPSVVTLRYNSLWLHSFAGHISVKDLSLFRIVFR